MSYTSQAAAYREMEVLAATPGQLVVIVYDQLLVSLRRARLALDGGTAELRGATLERCRAILTELLVTLDHDRGAGIARELSGLYTFFLAELVDVGTHRDARRLDRITAMVGELRDAFAQAAAETEGREAAR